MLTQKRLREIEHNKKILEKADKIWGRTGKAGALRLTRRVQLFKEIGKLSADKKVLEIGCGTGALTRYLADSGANITATDIFPEFLEVAQKAVRAANVKFKVLDAHQLAQLKNNYFDVVCGLSVLHHLNLSLALGGVRHALKQGGIAVFSEPNMLNPQIALQKNIPLLKRWAGDSSDETAFFSWRVRKALVEQGFKDIAVKPFDFLHPATPGFLLPLAGRFSLFLERVPLLKNTAGSLLIAAKKG